METPQIDSTPAPAPALVVTAPPADTVSATADAAIKGDFSAFKDAEFARRRGAPKPDVPATPAPVAATPATEPVAPATPTLSKRQQEQNERTRLAVERATADLRAENDRLRATHGTPAPAAPTTPPVAAEPEWKRLAALPLAPKLADFESVEEHAAAMAVFVNQQLDQERTQGEARERFESQRQRFLQDRGEKFQAKLQEAVAADPDFLDKIPPALTTARPLSGCIQTAQGLIDPGTKQPVTFANVAAEAAFRSEHPDVLLTYLHTHQSEVVALASLPESEWLTSLIHLDGRLSGPLTSAAPAAPAPAASATPSPISAAPPPPPTISRAGSTADPKRSALEKGDFAAFQALERAARAAKRATA